MSNRLDRDHSERRRSTLGPDVGMFDTARWKPLSADRLVDELVFLTATSGTLNLRVDTTELGDGRIRAAYVVQVVRLPSADRAYEPYIMTMSDPDDSKARPVCFVRTDVDLPDEA